MMTYLRPIVQPEALNITTRRPALETNERRRR